AFIKSNTIQAYRKEPMTSKKHAPRPYQKRLWLQAYAWQSLSHVQVTCDFVFASKIKESDPIYYPLLTAIFVLYARPFKRSNLVGSISPQMVPKKFAELHRQIIGLRDQMSAHLDADAF